MATGLSADEGGAAAVPPTPALALAPAPAPAPATSPLAGYSTRSISQWSADDVIAWAKGNKLKFNTVKLLEEDDVDGPLLREMSDGTLEKEYEVARPMQRKRIIQLIQKEIETEVAVNPSPNVSTPDSRYEFKRLLGKGSFSAVVLVHDSKQNIDVAKKIGNGGSLKDASKKLEESQTMVQLKHPNTVQFIRAFLDQDTYNLFQVNIIMEYCAGGDLQHRIETQVAVSAAQFSEPDVTHILSSCLQGLAHIHSRSLIHRDVKPGNILLAQNGAIKDATVKIGDFGLAKDFELKSLASRTMSMQCVSGKAGTEVFMAPEVYHGQRYKDTVDVWSLGITVTYMMSLKQPIAIADDAGKVAPSKGWVTAMI